MTLTELAKEIDTTPSMMTRFQNGETHSRKIIDALREKGIALKNLYDVAPRRQAISKYLSRK